MNNYNTHNKNPRNNIYCKIRYYHIKYFNQAYKNNEKYAVSVNDMIKVINQSKYKPEYALYEILCTPIRRLYLDIEGVPTSDPELINRLINDFTTFLNIPSNQYCLTLNRGSRHTGLSYHLLFKYKLHHKSILNIVRNFKSQYPSYSDYIDESVYDSRRLFRLPLQHSAINTKSVIQTDKYNREMDFHEIVKGDLGDFIIQNIKTIPFLNSKYTKCIRPNSDAKYISQKIDNTSTLIKECCDITTMNNIEYAQKFYKETVKHNIYTSLTIIMIALLLSYLINKMFN